MFQRQVTGERCFDINFLKEIEFSFLDDFEKWGWLKLLIRETKVYSSMVQLFYFNGELYHTDEEREKVENGVYVLPHADFHTRFNGKRIHITKDMIRNALGTPSCPDGSAQILGNFDYVLECKIIFYDDSLTARVKVTTYLSLHHRILHFIVCQNLNPRNGKFTDLTKRDTFWMYQIIIKGPP